MDAQANRSREDHMSNHLSRQVIISMFQSGHMVYRNRSERSQLAMRRVKGALPVFSTDTTEEATMMISSLCTRSGIDQILPFTGSMEDMHAVSEMMESFYSLMKRGYRGQELAAPFVEYKKRLGLDGLRL